MYTERADVPQSSSAGLSTLNISLHVFQGTARKQKKKGEKGIKWTITLAARFCVGLSTSREVHSDQSKQINLYVLQLYSLET